MDRRLSFRVVAAGCLFAAACSGNLYAQTISPKGAAGYTVGTFVPDGLLRSPSSVAADAAGNVYVADTGNYVVREFTPSGVGQVIAGTPGVNQLNDNQTVTPANRVAGVCYTTTGDYCLATQAILNGPYDIALDKSGHIYILDRYASRIRKIDVKTGIITRYAGGGGAGWSDLKLHSPSGMAMDAQGNLYVADRANNAIRKITPPVKPAKYGTITTIAGLGPNQPGCSIDGAVAATSMLTAPQDVAVDAAGNIYVADTGCRKVRKIATDGTISAIAGTGAGDVGTPPEVPFTASSGAALSINLGYPTAITLDQAGNLLISDLGFDVVWYYKAAKGTLHVLAGLAPGAAICSASTNPQGDGCHGDGAFINVPGKTAIDAAGDIYIPETGGHFSPSHPFDVRILKPLNP
jgi:streptogramin lyase